MEDIILQFLWCSFLRRFSNSKYGHIWTNYILFFWTIGNNSYNTVGFRKSLLYFYLKNIFIQGIHDLHLVLKCPFALWTTESYEDSIFGGFRREWEYIWYYSWLILEIFKFLTRTSFLPPTLLSLALKFLRNVVIHIWIADHIYTVHCNRIALFFIIFQCQYLSIALCYLSEILVICLSTVWLCRLYSKTPGNGP